MPVTDTEGALLQAVRDRIRSQLSYENSKCDVQVDGMPPPFAGEFYVAVHPAEWRADVEVIPLDEHMGIDVTLTMRLSHVPRDHLGGSLFLLALTGLNARLRAIIRQISMVYSVMDTANANIIGTEKLYDPLRFAGADPPRVVPGSWFHAEEDEEAGLVRTLHFTRARRTQDHQNFQ